MWQKIIFFLILSVFNPAFGLKLCRMQDHFKTSQKIKLYLDMANLTKVQKFIPHGISSSEKDNYVSINLEFSEIKNLRQQIAKKIKKKIDGPNARQEAHITLISGPEYNQILSLSGLTIKEINHLAIQEKIQDYSYSILGIGSACYEEDEAQGKKFLETYFLILKSEKFFEFRQKVKALALKKNKNTKQIETFNPDNFFPHITIGFTEKDLHPNIHGITKGIESIDSRFELLIR